MATNYIKSFFSKLTGDSSLNMVTFNRLISFKYDCVWYTLDLCFIKLFDYELQSQKQSNLLVNTTKHDCKSYQMKRTLSFTKREDCVGLKILKKVNT